jgi:hypothetical protein
MKSFCFRIFLIFTASTCFACKEDPIKYNFDYWLNQKDQEINQRGCVRDQIKFWKFAYQNRDNKKAIELGKTLRKRKILDKTILKLESYALFDVKRYDEALGAYLLSKEAQKKCRLFTITCHVNQSEFDSVFDHYLLYKYYRAANRKIAADLQLEQGNSDLRTRYPSEADFIYQKKWFSKAVGL